MFCWVESWAPCAQPGRRLAVSKSSCTWVRAARTGPAHLQRNGCHQRSCPGRSRAAERAEVVTRVRVLQASSRVRVLLSPVRKSYRSTQRGEGAQQDSGSVSTPKRVADRCSSPSPPPLCSRPREWQSRATHCQPKAPRGRPSASLSGPWWSSQGEQHPHPGSQLQGTVCRRGRVFQASLQVSAKSERGTHGASWCQANAVQQHPAGPGLGSDDTRTPTLACQEQQSVPPALPGRTNSFTQLQLGVVKGQPSPTPRPLL